MINKHLFLKQSEDNLYTLLGNYGYDEICEANGQMPYEIPLYDKYHRYSYIKLSIKFDPFPIAISNICFEITMIHEKKTKIHPKNNINHKLSEKLSILQIQQYQWQPRTAIQQSISVNNSMLYLKKVANGIADQDDKHFHRKATELCNDFTKKVILSGRELDDKLVSAMVMIFYFCNSLNPYLLGDKLKNAQYYLIMGYLKCFVPHVIYSTIIRYLLDDTIANTYDEFNHKIKCSVYKQSITTFFKKSNNNQPQPNDQQQKKHSHKMIINTYK